MPINFYLIDFLKNWKDEGISWNPSDYGGITMLRLPIENVWNPVKLNS